MFATMPIRRLLRNENGATAIEYGLIAALIVIAIIGGVNLFAIEAIDMLNLVSTAVENARPS